MIGSVYTKVVSLIADLDWKASILWQTNILDLKTRDYLDAGYDLFRNVAWKVPVLVEPVAIQFVANSQPMRVLLKHDVARAHVDGFIQDRMNKLDHCLLIFTAASARLVKLVGLYHLKIMSAPPGTLDREHRLHNPTRVDCSAFRRCDEALKRNFICQDLLNRKSMTQRSFNLCLQARVE